MWDKILPWIGGIFAAVGVVLVFYDVITTIKRRDKTKTNIAGLVILSVAVVGYVITDLVLPNVMENSPWPPLASFAWIALFWVYVLLDAVVTMGDIKRVRRERKQAKSAAATEAEQTEQTQSDHNSSADAQEKDSADDNSEQ